MDTRDCRPAGHGIQIFACNGSSFWVLDIGFTFHSSRREPWVCARELHRSAPYNFPVGNNFGNPLQPLLLDVEQLANADPSSRYHDVPVHILRRNLLRMALGDLPRNVENLVATSVTGRSQSWTNSYQPELSPADASRISGAPRDGPFTGDYSIGTWNAQALFARDFSRYQAKSRYAHRLAGRFNVMIWTETHGTADGNQAWREPTSCTSWWSPWTSPAAAGVGITVQNKFLEQFDAARTRWDIIIPGRAAVLRLRGTSGHLDIFAVYFPTGPIVLDEDIALQNLDGTLPSSNFGLRMIMRRILARAILPAHEVLSILAGDFNWVTHADDRISLANANPSGQRDTSDERHWQAWILKPFKFVELSQVEMTHASVSARSRLDRIYTNQHTAEQLDRRIWCAALEWTQNLSAHRAVVASRSSPQPLGADRPIPEHIIHHKDWPCSVSREFHQLCIENPNISDIGKLKLLKTAMRHAAKAVLGKQEMISEAFTLEDRLGITLRFLRALEVGRLGSVSSCLLHYPKLKDLVRNPYLKWGGDPSSWRRVQDHALELARDHALDELGKLHRDLPGLSESEASVRRKKNLLLIHRLAPGRGASVQAVRDDHGDVQTSAHGMAGALRAHWEKVFCKKNTCRATRQRWIDEDVRFRPQSSQSAQDSIWNLTQADVERALRRSGNSSPGPDGIPFSAWRACFSLAAPVMFAALTQLTSADGLDTLQEDYPEFNESILTFLPKKSDEVDLMGTPIYAPANTRPLNITNADNRILSNTVRLKIEPIVGPEISLMQRGFVPGRSMLANVVDVESGMQLNSLKFLQGLALFPDFAAAFPSVDHEFIHDFLATLDWPEWLTYFVRVLYTNNRCYIATNGTRMNGFGLEAGIRQGCPLSPLLFAVLADLILRRLQRFFPTALIRAYADDIAMVLDSGVGNLKKLESVFREYGLLSGLHVHHGKTVIVPLAPNSLDQVKALIISEVPSWADMRVKYFAEYLGFVLGPECDEKSWEKGFKKYIDRAKTWGGIGGGLFHTFAAYRTYILPVLSFIAQLAIVPHQWEELEQRACKLLFPGPRNWISAGALRGLKHIGFSDQLPDLHSLAAGAKCRVARYENALHGGLQLSNRVVELRRARVHGEFALRSAVWYRWYETSPLENLTCARESLRSKIGAEANLVNFMNGNVEDPTVVRQQWQKASRLVLERSAISAVELHLRRRLDRWDLHLLAGHRVRRAILSMKNVAAGCPPRVCASLLRSWCNGWVTARRMQDNGACILGCGGEDSIEHYAACQIFRGFCVQKLFLTPKEDPLGCFLCLVRESTAETRKRALALYALYSLHGIIRHGGNIPGNPHDALLQIARDTAGQLLP